MVVFKCSIPLDTMAERLCHSNLAGADVCQSGGGSRWSASPTRISTLLWVTRPTVSLPLYAKIQVNKKAKQAEVRTSLEKEVTF